MTVTVRNNVLYDFLVLLLLLEFLCSCNNRQYYVEVGKKLPGWTEGCLDIHSINSGRGECTFYILPDGTTMLVDAGEFRTSGSKYQMVRQRPDTLVRPYGVYTMYICDLIDRSLSDISHYSIDYALATHYHMDHIGRIEKGYEMSDSGYVKTGMTALYDRLPYRKIIDRSFPEYSDENDQQNWKRFVESVASRDGTEIEKFDLGSRDQIKLLHNPDKYPDFRIVNYHVNGLVWNNGKVIDCWKDKKVTENGASIGFLLSYGKFDWFSGGDAGSNGRVAGPTACAINREIETMKGLHHMSWNTMSGTMMNIYNPMVVVNQSFYSHQPWPATMEETLKKGMPDGKVRDVFLTNLHEDTYRDSQDLLAEIKSCGGHIVIRVMPGGGSFYVYMLDDNDFNYIVRDVFGPYMCR